MTCGAAVALVLSAAPPASAIGVPTDVTITIDPDGGGVKLHADTDPSGPSKPKPPTNNQPPANPRPRPTQGPSGTGTSGRPAAPRSPIEVRQEAMDEIKLTRPKIGASPCLAAGAGCTGTVGVPVWLWVGDGDGELPTDSASAEAGAFDIKATAKVTQVKWSLGDGQSTLCSGTEAKYDVDRDGWSAPECGFEHGWKKPGTYTLTATYVWQVAWTGDETGSVTQAMSSTQQVTVGELQSVATKR
ncbi:hypothetical protein ASG73_04150 [Janibacter sp. Soil728]|nr:hypothetical protein ASG73_04150 [Janibacter sp. Soil728]